MLRRLTGLVIVATTLAISLKASAAESAVRLEVPNATIRAGTATEVVLVNDTDRPIFLNWTFPGSVALPHRRSETTGTWEAGKRPIQCGTVEHPDSPREFPPRSRVSMPIWWDSATREIDGVKAFYTQAGEYLKLHGTFRVVVSYSLEPWTIGHRPSTILEVASEPFEVKP